MPISEALSWLKRQRLPILVFAGVLGGGWFVFQTWLGHRGALSASYSVQRVTLPRDWQTGLKEPQVQVLTIRISKSSSKRVQVDDILIDSVHRIHSITVSVPQNDNSADLKWVFKQHETGQYGSVRISNAPTLLAGHATFEIYVWGMFPFPQYLDVTVHSDNEQLTAVWEESSAKATLFTAENLLWFFLFALAGIIGGVLAYVDKHKQ